jgi:hypothetical protein
VQALEAAVPNLNMAILMHELIWAICCHRYVAPTTVFLLCCVIVASHAFLGVLFAASFILLVDVEPVLPMATIVWMIRTGRHGALEDQVRIAVPFIATGSSCRTHDLKLLKIVILCSKLHPIVLTIRDRHEE